MFGKYTGLALTNSAPSMVLAVVTPELVNSSPYEKAWMIEIKASVPGETDSLMDRDAYLTFLEGIK